LYEHKMANDKPMPGLKNKPQYTSIYIERSIQNSVCHLVVFADRQHHVRFSVCVIRKGGSGGNDGNIPSIPHTRHADTCSRCGCS